MTLIELEKPVFFLEITFMFGIFPHKIMLFIHIFSSVVKKEHLVDLTHRAKKTSEDV